MAFMMPVVKNDWDIYKSNRSRRVSECSNSRSCRSRKVSETKSEGPSLSTSPGSGFLSNSPGHRSVPANMSRQYSRTSSRTSEFSLQSPCKSISSSPPKSASTKAAVQTTKGQVHENVVPPHLEISSPPSGMDKTTGIAF
ncbi:hypothetical protein Trydic_g20698 [Trypoxylus dichotomus]